ncbi:RecQ family ATP-dependent DNA helicase [Cellulosimicrobium cellulans]|uniref:RecQ family ATP-dependent DNA helicase n=1 Tax=Cellulosimicrobium cellulans TaxID=1710 RepID=UPI00240654C0|nr:RecQ family ATP-dependent DNA helicase [Cellulosimicrobium cellulans]MDF9877382.1 ATP-dependent DNA helicase RecQ [Cellulosimicrobium cellulans]
MTGEPTLTDVRDTAREVFGYRDLRPGQREAITALLDGRDVLLVLPTGAGKSAVYQLPGLELPGPTLVVSPLIALQQDQVRSLLELGDDDARAAAVSSAVPAAERRAALEAAAAGELEFLFLSPEQLANDEVLDAVRAARPSLVAVDEAHCVSTWGHDFRPEYLRVGERLDTLDPRPPVLALTATASPPVREDVAERLHLRDAAVIVRGFARPGIALEVVRAVEAADKDRAVVERVRAETEHGVGIVYVRTRRRTTEVADALAEAGLRTAAYHGGLRRAERDEAQRRFTEDEVDVVVATSAFGMGIDKPDVRFVVHADVPGSPDSYYQEVGRAGRDGEPAVAVLFYRPEDLGLQRYFAVSVPDRDDLREVARALGRGGPDDQAPGSPASGGRARLPRRLARLRALVEDARALAGEDARPATVADVAHELAEARRRVDDSRLQMMRAYAETTQCRRQFLLAYLGEDLPEPCGRCDTCWAGSAAERAADDRAAPWSTGTTVQHPEFGAGTVMGYEGDDRVTVLFETHGYRTLSLDAVAEQDLLTPS